MKVGIYLDLRNPPGWRRGWQELYAQKLDRVVEAERSGLDSVWLSEHHLFEDGYLPQPLTFASAIASRTSRIRIGTAVLLAPLRPAVQIAEEAAIVDLVSGGRLELGLGSGYLPDEFAAYGADHGRRFATLWERVQEVRGLWDEGRTTPPPAQARPRIWVGVGRKAAARRVGLLGESLLWLDPGILDDFRAGLAEGGHDPSAARVSGPAQIVLADDPEAAREAIREHHAYQQGSYLAQIERQLPPGDSAPLSMARPLRLLVEGEREADDTPLPPSLHVLTPDQAGAWLAAWLQDSPVEHVFFWDSIAGMPDELADRHVALLASELAPRLATCGAVPAA